jgi:hypothetical protein
MIINIGDYSQFHAILDAKLGCLASREEHQSVTPHNFLMTTMLMNVPSYS